MVKTGWHVAGIAPNAVVFTPEGCPVLADIGAALVGTLFDRKSPARQIDALDDELAAALQAGSCADLFVRHWGSYVAFGADGHGLDVFRDPSGAVMCCYAKVPGGVLLGSGVTELITAGLPLPSVSLDVIARGLFDDGLPSPQTGFTGVKELLPGNRLRITTTGCLVQQVWSPWDHVTPTGTTGFFEHAARVRETVQTSVATLAGTRESILLGLSGGLDSSIVAACLADTLPQPRCVTVSTRDAEGDERAHARQVSTHFGLPLVEAAYDLADIDLSRPARPDAPRPTGRLIAQGYNAAVGRVATQVGAGAFFAGNGGDNVFAFSQSAGAIVDRYLHEGPSFRLLITARDICRLTGADLPHVWRAARRLLRQGRRYRWKVEPRYLSEQVMAACAAKPPDHHWLDGPADALPGKAAHVAALLRIQRHIEGSNQFAPAALVNPLMTQPVIETCLAVPTWEWCREGRNRSVAREAFRSILPDTIIERRSKGGPNGFAIDIVTRLRRPILERLLDGHLAAAGLVDRGAIELRLRDESPNWNGEQVRILELLEAEAWIDHWRSL